MSLEDTKEFELDVKNTIYSNILNIGGLFVLVFYITIFNRTLNTFLLPEMRVLGLMVFAYSVLKIMFAITDINLEYKPRQGDK